MKTAFIHDKFELDISNFELIWIEENTWFKDEFFLNSSFPFEIDYSFHPFFEKYKHLNFALLEFAFQGKLIKDGKIENAILEIDSAEEKLQMTIRYGIEALSNWTKKLSELTLDVVLPNGGDMTLHANSIITQTYPAVNYNFPAIHSEFYAADPLYEHFKGIINNRTPSGWILNTETFDEIKNRNIVYPFPYHLYVLQKAIEDAGYILKGDILSDPDLIDAVIIPGKKIFEFENLPQPVDWTVTDLDMDDSQGTFWYPAYVSSIEVNFRGSFRLIGSISRDTENCVIKFNNQVIYSYPGSSRNIDVMFESLSESNLLEFKSINPRISGTWATMILRTNYLLDEFGEKIPYLANFSKVQLADKLPDITVGDFIKFHKRLKNYDFDLRNDNEIWMNLITNELTASEVVDVSEFEPVWVNRKFEQSKSFVLKYESDFEEYEYPSLFVDQNGFARDDFLKKENTEEIIITGIPLPTKLMDGFNTAVQLSDDASKLMLAKYNGLVNGENWTQPMKDLDTYSLYIKYWQNWLNFIIHAVRFTWIIKGHPQNFTNITRKSKLFSFGNLSFVFSLNKKRRKNIEEIEIEAYSTKI